MNELKNDHSYISQIFSKPDAEFMPAKLGKTVFDHPNVAPWVDKDSQITIRVGRAKKVNGNEGHNMPSRLEFYGTAAAIFGAIAIGVWTVSTRIDDKVSESRVELNTTMQNNKTEILTAFQNSQNTIIGRIDKLEDRSRDDSKTLSKIELLLESKQEKK